MLALPFSLCPKCGVALAQVPRPDLASVNRIERSYLSCDPGYQHQPELDAVRPDEAGHTGQHNAAATIAKTKSLISLRIALQMPPQTPTASTPVLVWSAAAVQLLSKLLSSAEQWIHQYSFVL